MSKQPFEIRVDRIDDENPNLRSYYSFYNIEAEDYDKAERKAIKQFWEDFGAPEKGCKAFTFNKQQQ